MAMALAVALGITAPDHWQASNPLGQWLNGSHAHPAEVQERDSHGDEERHARHCHGDAATCSDLPLTATGGFIALAALLLFGAGDLLARRLWRDRRAPSAWAQAPLLPPPRPLSALL